MVRDILARTVNGQIHRIAPEEEDKDVATFLGERRPSEWVQDDQGVWVSVAHIVQVWDVPKGAHAYAHLE